MTTNPFTKQVLNSFCPTGKGGGIDPGCGKGKSGGGAATSIDSMSRVNRNGVSKEDGEFVKSQIKFSDAEGSMELALDKEFKAFDGSKQEFIDTFATEETLSLSQLESGQKIVEAKGVEHFLKQPDSEDKLPLVIQYKDRMIVRDGNTRVNAMLLKGQEKSKFRVLYVSEN